MILLFIITSILYLIMMFFVITLYYTYRKDIEELESGLLHLEKKQNEDLKYYKHLCSEVFDEIVDLKEKVLEVEKLMACKRGKRKK